MLIESKTCFWCIKCLFVICKTCYSPLLFRDFRYLNRRMLETNFITSTSALFSRIPIPDMCHECLFLFNQFITNLKLMKFNDLFLLGNL